MLLNKSLSVFVQLSEVLLSPRQVTPHDCPVDCDKVVMCLGAMDPYSAVSIRWEALDRRA